MKISFIVPVYNAESTLKRCVDSIVCQTNVDWELFLIDDGSVDRSGYICDEYASCDERIVVIHKENEGVSIARNTALNLAKGDYVTFVDSDDYISGDLSSVVNGTLFDLVVFGSQSIGQDGRLKIWYSIEDGIIEVFYNIKSFIKEHINTFVLDGPCAKLLNRDLIGTLRFPQGQTLGEDNVFMLRYITKCNKIRLTNDCNYIIEDHYNNESRYRMSAENATIYFNNIIQVYNDLNIEVRTFEERMFQTFFCVIDPQKKAKIWFSNDIVKKYEKKYLKQADCSFKIRYYSLKYPLCGRFYSILKIFKHAILNIRKRK